MICTRTLPASGLYHVSVACDGCHAEGPRVPAASLPFGSRLARQRARQLNWLPAYQGRDWCPECVRTEVRS